MRYRWRAVLVVCSFVAALAASPALAKPIPKDDRGKQKIQHIVVVMMENRSFDHLLGWHPTANAMNAELSYPDEQGIDHATQSLAPDFQGCGHPDPDHSWEGGRVDLNGGAMDGFLLAGQNDDFAIGYYNKEDRPFFNALALNYTVCDNFYSGILAETFPNRIFMHAAQTDRLTNTMDPSTLPTIWDRLEEKGISRRYYISDFSFLALWAFKGGYFDITRPYDQFLADAAAGTLPAVSFVEPSFRNEEEGLSNDDHPHADIRAGDAFLAKTFNAVSKSPNWPGTVFIVTYDEWGGFFDHVAPPRAAAPNDVDPDIVDGKTLLGMRIPVVVASPFSRGSASSPRVVSNVYDNTSILKLIEWRFGLTPLTARDASNDVGNLATALNLSNFFPTVPALPNPAPPPENQCPSTQASSGDMSSSEVGLEDLGQLQQP